MRLHPVVAAIAAMSLLLVGVFLALLPGINGTFYYDDLSLLNSLPEFYSGALSFYQYMQGGFIVGSLGRPLSMLSFLWPASAYPDHAQAIFALNIALHVTNTLLVGLLAWRIGLLLETEHALWLGVLTAAFWGLAPIQVGTVLIAVQRMTELSAFFVFLGLLLWVVGLQRAKARPGQGRILQAIGLLGMSILAILSKENGVLLPVFAGVIEASLLARLALPDRKARQVLYLASTAVVVGYLVFYTWYYQGVYWERNFNIWERLMTEAGILFEYLRQSIAPRFLDIHPFHDAYPVVRSLMTSPLNMLAVLFWPVASLLAWVWRRRYPVFAFALLWYVVAHLLESSVIGLELYFEHRQYPAWFGPAFAIVWTALHVPRRYQMLARIGLVIYALFLGLVMRQTAEVWGNPETSARIWFERSPGSARAAEFLARDALARHQGDQALEILEQQIQACPECLSSIAQAVQISCVLGREDVFARQKAAFFEQAPKVAMTFSTGGTLLSIHDHISKGQCTLMDFEELQRMNELMLARTQTMFDTKRQELLLNLYRIAVERGDLERAATLMPQMFQALPRPELAVNIVRNLLELGHYEQASDFVSTQVCHPSVKDGFWLRGEWSRACAQTRNMLRQP